MKNLISGIKNSLNKLTKWLDIGWKVSEPEGRSIEMIKTEDEKKGEEKLGVLQGLESVSKVLAYSKINQS